MKYIRLPMWGQYMYQKYVIVREKYKGYFRQRNKGGIRVWMCCAMYWIK